MCVVPGLIALELQTFHSFAGAIDQILIVSAGILIFGSAVSGVLLATYTGVLIGATAIPAWFLHHKLLPIHFGTAGLGSAAALLELLGHRIAPLNAIGLFAAAVETVLLIWLSIDRHVTNIGVLVRRLQDSCREPPAERSRAQRAVIMSIVCARGHRVGGYWCGD